MHNPPGQKERVHTTAINEAKVIHPFSLAYAIAAVKLITKD